jgi:hypothetical protein
VASNHERLILLAERALALTTNVIADSIVYEWGDYYGDWQQVLTVHYAVATPTGIEHRHHYLT